MSMIELLMQNIFPVLVIGFFLLLAGIVILPAFFGAPWHPLSNATIRHILDFAEVAPGDKVYDLGSGDGRILISAAKDYGAEGVGVEIDPVKVWISRLLARMAGVADRVRVVRGSVYDFDCRSADVLFLHLTHQMLDKLFPEIQDRLKPSVRIVCFKFSPRKMSPQKFDGKNLYLYTLAKGRKVNEYS